MKFNADYPASILIHPPDLSIAKRHILNEKLENNHGG